jgi:uroporphyrin-III C-methyltransferase
MASSSQTGRVSLVGAGPGDADLLTRRAAARLADADVVLHDQLVGPDVLALVSPTALVVDVGKRKGRGWRQRDIERLLVEHAQRGAHVVRLNGGDPFLFGRGTEEVAACTRAGIAVEVVPGVSAALAAPALAGVAVTSRDVSAHVTVLSGHLARDDDRDWSAFVRVRGTLVILMAASTGSAIAARLIAAGMDPATPTAVTVDASLPDQRVLGGTIADLAARTSPLPAPAVITVGAVAASARADLPLAQRVSRVA